MEQLSALNERIRSLKAVAASMHEGAIHTELIPEIDKVLALPEHLEERSVSELEAIGRQTREYEQVFDAMGFTLLDQLMPTTGVSPVFRVVRAADAFRQRLRRAVGQHVTVDAASAAGSNDDDAVAAGIAAAADVADDDDGAAEDDAGGERTLEVEQHTFETMTRYGLSIGTPPVTDQMQLLVSRTLFGRHVHELFDFLEVLDCNRTDLADLIALLIQLVDGSMHYNTAAEERAFLDDAAEFVNCEGGRLFNRVVITESPERVIFLIGRYVFDKFGTKGTPPVRLVEGLDQLDHRLIQRMRAEPNHVFVARITHLPHGLFQQRSADNPWLAVLGRLILIDCSARARRSNTTIVYTLFPHVARTLRNIQTSFAGRPANTQLVLRRIFERFNGADLARLADAVQARIDTLTEDGVLDASVDDIRAQEWTKTTVFNLLSLIKLRRLFRFLEGLAVGADLEAGKEAEMQRLGDGAATTGHAHAVVDKGEAGSPTERLKRRVAERWMRYFYKGLPPERYRAAVVPGGGRGALTLVGEYHRERTHQLVETFREDHLASNRERLEQLKVGLDIPASSTDEIQAAVRQSQLRALSPTQWRVDSETSFTDHLARTMVYRAADAAGRFAGRTRHGLDRAAFGNIAGGAAALIKRTMKSAGLGALHGRLEDVVGKRVGDVDRRVRDVLAPMQDAVRSAERSLSDIKGDLDPVAVSEVEAVLAVIEHDVFYPTLILPEMSWTYHDVFPEKDYPPYNTLRVGLNPQREMDPHSLERRLEQLRYLFREFPEIFELWCKSTLLVLNTPHNPTGVVYRRETVLKLLGIAAEYGLTIVDDNAYHKILTSSVKGREGDRCVAQIYETFRSRFDKPVHLITVGATTKGLQGSGDRTGLVHSSVAEVVEFVEAHASRPHELSLYLTELKLESGLAVKRTTGAIEELSAALLDPTAGVAPHRRVHELLEKMLQGLGEDDFPVAVFETLLEGYERLLRLKNRGALPLALSQEASELVESLKQLRLERNLRKDVGRRLEQAKLALLRADQNARFVDPGGAFYFCLELPGAAEDDRGVQAFLEAIADARGADFTYAGFGFVRMSLGGTIEGDRASYDRLGHAIELYCRLLLRYWAAFEASGRDLDALPRLFDATPDRWLPNTVADLAPLLDAAPPRPTKTRSTPAMIIENSERGLVYCIEEGRSRTDKIVIAADRACDSVDELLSSRPFRVIYRRLLRKTYRNDVRLADMSFGEVENQYGPLACLTAYHDRQLIDDVFRDLLVELYQAWHGANTVRVLAAQLGDGTHHGKTAALQGINARLSELINELMYSFGVDAKLVTATGTFEVGYERLEDIAPNPQLPRYLQRIVAGCTFAGATTALDPAPAFTTGAAKRVGDYRYGFIRRDDGDDADHAGGTDGDEQQRAQLGDREAPPLSYFQRRFALLPELAPLRDYVCKAVQVGPFKMLLMIHRSYLHLISDELRLFPQIEEVQRRENLESLAWDGVLLFGLPAKLMGESYKTGYVHDRCLDGSILPTAWVCREDATDYVGFLKKSLLTLHNERVKAMGGFPVHGAMITITFKNGLRKTLVFSADSGTGKSETITAMMEQMVSGGKLAAELDRVDILAGDMLSLWRGDDGQIYAFGTETGDFMRLTDITEAWQRQFADLLKRGSYSNLDHPKNPRVTVPGICERRRVLSPTRVNAFFYINNYEQATGALSVEIIEDPGQVLKHILVRGLRKNKGTSGDQPNLRAGLEFADAAALVTRYRYELDYLLTWEPRDIDGEERTCLVYRDGAEDVYAARDVVTAAFVGKPVTIGGQRLVISAVDYDVGRNLFRVRAGGRRPVLDRSIYDQCYEPLVSTFCGNPFVDPDGMDRTLGIFAEVMREALVHTGVVKTQLARPGYEYSGPAQAAEDLVAFLLEDEEVNARFQRNKYEVARCMAETYGEVLEAGMNPPVELEGYNLLLLEEHESHSVQFRSHRAGRDPRSASDDLGETSPRLFTVPTPYYQHNNSDESQQRGHFHPAIALPEHVATIADICQNPDYDMPFDALNVDLDAYQRIRFWNSVEELTYQILLLNGVISLGSSETELARFPFEVRKAHFVAQRIVGERTPDTRSGPQRSGDEASNSNGNASSGGGAAAARRGATIVPRPPLK